MTRKEANKEILKELEKLINKYPEQRMGQLLCNYVFPFYRERDIFFEESTDTLKTIQSYL